ncbi:unnamed protein product [Psylliodes chrysocephalus]|uniref:Ubiquitin-like domain-containing protein n=1 Tax=Psylliodes chrysocephalus TaxID=3402493 RepID=A0A9P0GA22_9CUCU|nr:unnamed protein product [Psylliodes chrysocephala]
MSSLRVKTPIGKIITIDVAETDKVSDLKQKIYDHQLVRTQNQILRLNNSELADQMKISEAQIGDEVLQLDLKQD